MSSKQLPRRSLPLLLCIVLGAIGILVWGRPLIGASPAEAADAETLVAGSVCEAQELRARQAEDPYLQIEIPPQFDKRFPSLSACEAHELAWDPAAPGPLQPIPFSHAHHAGVYEIPCQYCHAGTDRSRVAGVPSVQLCMGCHANFPAEFDELEGIRILKQHWEEQRPIEWQQIHRLPEHVKFRHNRHVAVGIDCQRCHGAVQKIHKLSLIDDTVWWQYGLPARKLEMGWCIQCHRKNEATQDCLACHY